MLMIRPPTAPRSGRVLPANIDTPHPYQEELDLERREHHWPAIAAIVVCALALCVVVSLAFLSGRPAASEASRPGPATAADTATADEVAAEATVGSTIVRDCFEVDEHSCLTANPKLHPALAVLKRTALGSSLLEIAARSGVAVRIGSLPAHMDGEFRPKAHTVTISTRVASMSARGQAGVLAHELKHVANASGVRSVLPNNTFNCYSDEASAFTTEVAVWKELRGDSAPSDSLEMEEDDIAQAMDTRGLGFWLEMGQLYHDECR